MAVRHSRTIPTVRPSLKVRRIPDWEAAGLAGLFGGLTFMVLEMVLTPLLGAGSVWDPPRLVVAALFGESRNALPSESAGLAIALFAHFTMSLVYARIMALLLFRSGAHPALTGTVFGLALYFLNFYVLGSTVMPALAEGRGLPWVLSHVGFGVVAATVYKRLERVAYE